MALFDNVIVTISIQDVIQFYFLYAAIIGIGIYVLIIALIEVWKWFFD